MRRHPTSYDVAKHAGVSQTAVSFVLSGRTDMAIAPSTRERILASAKAIGYRPNRVAASLVQGRTNTIAVLVLQSPDSFWTALVAAIEEHCAKNDYRVLLATAGSDETVLRQQARILQEHRVDGFIIIGECESHASRGWFVTALDEGTPIVIIDQLQDGVDNILSDDYGGAKAAMRYIFAEGHRHIAHISGDPRRSTALARKAAYLDSLREEGIDVDESLIVGESWEPEEVRSHVERLISSPDRPTAFFAANDFIAAAALQVALELGVRVPGELTIVGYGDTEVGRSMGLTTASQNPNEMSRLAVERLLTLIDDPNTDHARIVVPTELIVRRSSGPPSRIRPAEALKI